MPASDKARFYDMENKETRELIRDLAGSLLDLVGHLQDAEDVVDEHSYAKEIAIYDRAKAWLKEQNLAEK